MIRTRSMLISSCRILACSSLMVESRLRCRAIDAAHAVWIALSHAVTSPPPSTCNNTPTFADSEVVPFLLLEQRCGITSLC